MMSSSAFKTAQDVPSEHRNPRAFLLEGEPDLTPAQIWVVLIADRHEKRWGGDQLREIVVAADTIEEVQDLFVRRAQTQALAALSLSTLKEGLEAIQDHPVHKVGGVATWVRPKRFLCLFEEASASNRETAVRPLWIQAASRHVAQQAWRELGESKPPLVVLDFDKVHELYKMAEDVRAHRGVGGYRDARHFDHPDQRKEELEAQRWPGGQAEYEAELQANLEYALSSTPSSD